NGTWTRAPAALTFTDDTGDIALYYRENSQAAPAGLTITLSVSSPAYWQGAVADYSGVALAGTLDQIVSKRFSDGSSVDTGPTPPASRPRARPPHRSPSRGRPPLRAVSPAMPCTATVPPSARRGPTPRSSWTRM